MTTEEAIVFAKEKWPETRYPESGTVEEGWAKDWAGIKAVGKRTFDLETGEVVHFFTLGFGKTFEEAFAKADGREG